MNNEKGTDYLDIKYNEKDKPKTDFPIHLGQYLINRFNIKPGEKLLEIGCGRCEMLNSFSELGLNISGVDSSEKTRDYAPKTISRLEILDTSQNIIPFDENEFDIIFTKSVIEHIFDPSKLMKEIMRMLKPGGLFIVLTPDWISQMNVFYDDPTHIHPYQPKGLKDLLMMSGFHNVDSEIFYYHELLWTSASCRFVASFLRIFLSTTSGRKISDLTGIKLFRWGVEKQVLGYGFKKKSQ